LHEPIVSCSVVSTSHFYEFHGSDGAWVTVILFAVVEHRLNNFWWWDPIVTDALSGGVSEVPVVALIVIKVVAPGFNSLFVGQTTIGWESGSVGAGRESSLGNSSTESLHF